MSETKVRDKGSFRDNFGSIYTLNKRTFRALSLEGKNHFNNIIKSGVLNNLMKKNYFVKTEIVNDKDILKLFKGYDMLLEHKTIDYITYPYEWSFEQLKTAALFHLDLQLDLLDLNLVLRDASAYNIQYNATKPIFIDILSIATYNDGEIWFGYKQFCEQFLYPLLMNVKTGISHRQFYRGNLEGISRSEIVRLLPTRSFFSFDAITHIIIPRLFEQKTFLDFSNKKNLINKISKKKYRAILQNLKNWISTLVKKEIPSTWSDYEKNNSYSINEKKIKKKIIHDFIKKYEIKSFLDIGCNTGEFSLAALDKGAEYGVAIDFDEKSIDQLFTKCYSQNLNLLPLCIDLTNPSPNQGWIQMERKGFLDRFSTDASFSLALVHHLVISKNININEVVRLLTSFSKKGLIEFVPTNDEMAQILIRQRRDNKIDYTQNDFESALLKQKKIISKTEVKMTGRILYEYG